MTGHRQFNLHSSEHPLRKGVKRGQRSSDALHPLIQGSLRAQDLVEFALVFPILIFFILGIFDFGRTFHVLIAISNAAREGARYGIGPGLDRSDPNEPPVFITRDNEIKAAAVQEAGNFNLKLALADVTVSCPNTCVGEENLRVTVSYTFTPIFVSPIFDILFPSPDFTIVRDMEMMIP